MNPSRNPLVKIQALIRDDQAVALEKLVKKNRVTQSSYVRYAIDSLLAAPSIQADLAAAKEV